MISKLLIADVNVSDDMKSLLNSLKGDDVLITYYNYSQGFIVENKNLLVDKLLTLIRSHLETSTVNFEHLCFVNVEQMKTPTHSSKYNNENHAISGIESKPDALDSWNFMGKLVADIAKTTEIRNIDFIDIDHLCFPKEHAVIFDKIQEVTKDVEDRTINYLKVGEEDKETIYKSNNWLHTMMTTFYNDENKVLLDKYFKINNSNIGFLNTKILKPRNFQIYDSHVPSIDFESGTLNVSIIPLYCYASDADYDLMGDFIKSLNSNTILEFIHITDTMAEFKSRMIHILDKYCGENKDKINKVNVAVWLNPNISNQSLMFSNHISANIDQELAEVVNQLTTNNTENVDQLQNHFVVQVNEAFIEYFNMNVYDNMDVNIINFEIFNISDTYNTNYNLFCHFLHNDYYVSTLVNFNLTFITSSDITDNLFELSDKIVDFDEEGNIIDVSQSLFKDSQLMTDISNNETYHDDLFISNTSHINKSIQYNKDINLATYLSSDGPEIEKFMKQNVITNVILYDRELREHLSDVRGCLLPNTLLLTFDKQNTYQDIKDGLLRLNELNGVQISNIALFQDNDSRSKTYNFVGEETSIVKYPMMDDPSLNTWSKFQDFVLFLDTEMNVKYLDLMMCKIYSNPNWKYVIDTISSNLSSLVIRSSENNTGHTMFEGDWILESPVVDVNMINLYFKESIKELDIQLGTNVTPSEGMVFPKLTDSDSNEISGNLYVSGGKTYISYEITSTSTINFSHDLNNVDIFIVAGGGGANGNVAGQGGGAGGAVVATGINSITSGEHTITVGDGGSGGTSASSWASESGGNSEAFGYIAMGGGRGGGNNTNGANGGSGGGNDGWPNHVYGRSVGYHSDSETFEFTGGSANYNNDSSTYPNVMIYGYNGGGSSQNAWNGTSAGGGGAGGAGGTGNNSNYHSGAGGVGMTNNFLNGVDKYYAGGGGGGNLHVGYNEGAGGNGGGGAGGNVPNSGSYSIVGIDGTPNTGGGGGGASAGNGGSGANGGSGGSGVVIFRFVLAENENLPAVSSGTEDYSTKFYNYNTGEALASAEEQVNEYETKTINAFTESTTAYLNYDISVAEIKEYVAPVSTGGNTFGDISNVPEDFVFSTTQNAGTFTQGTTISIIDTLETSDDPNNNKSYTFTLSSNSVITELNFTPTNYSGDYTSLYYVIQENTNTILKQTNNTLQDENFIESRVDFSNGTQDLLQVGDTKVIIENNTNENKDYVLLFYTLEGTGSALLDSGKLNRYLYDGYGGTEYTNIIPAWSYFSTFNSSALVTNTAIPDHGDYYNYLYDGYVYYTETTTKHFGTTGDDDTFVWIVEGDKKWSTVGHPHRAGYSWIVNNIPNATLVCYRGGRGGPNSTYTGTMFGSYTFQANTLYTILMKFTEHTGGINFSFGISNTSLNNQTRRTTTFPSQFHATVGAGGIAQGSSLEYSITITSDSITPPVVDISSQIVSLSAGVYNVVIDKPAVSEPISTDDLQMEYIANTNTSTTTTWTSTYTADGTSHDMNIPSWPLTTTNDEYYYTIDNKNSAYPYYPTASKNYHYNDLDDCTTTGQKGLTYEAWIYVDSWPADGTEPGTSSADPKRGAWGWLMGLHTGNAMYLILNQEAIGGIGMHPPANRSTHGTTYELNNGTSLTNPGYITENTQQLLHIVGYMYPTSTTDVERGVYINGTHYPQFSLLQSNSAIPDMFNNQTYNFTINNLQNDWFGACKTTRLYSFRVWHRQLTETEINSIYSMGPYGSILSQPTSDISTNITLDLSTNTITSNVDFEIKYTPIDLSLSELTKDTTINPVRSQTIPFVKSNGNQEERSVTLHGDATYNRFANEYYFPGDLSGYASIEGQLFGEHAMSMSFMYKSGGEQPVLETINNDGEIKHFSTNGTLTLTEDATVDILIVGGGGAGGNALGGGGGAGGVVYTVNQTMTAGTYNIFVGAGGQGQDYSAGSVESNNGEDSYISDSNGSIITMDMGGVTQELKGHGGGGGGSRRELGSVYSTSYNGIGNNGGSSGGVGAPSYYNTFDSGGNLILSNLPNATPTQLDTFYDVSTQTYIKGGSDGSTYASKGTGSLVRWTSGGGGGGMGPANDDGSVYAGHDGDDGIYVDICGGITVAAGGGGAQYSHHLDVHYASDVNYGKGGSGIGGDGAVYDANNGQNAYWGVDVGSQFYERGIPTSGLDGTGSGGGGWSDRQKYNDGSGLAYHPAGSGGSGIVIIKIHLDPPPPVRNTITYIGHPYPSPLNQNAHDTNDFAIYSSPNDQASIFYKEDDTSIKEVPSATFDNSSNYTHIAITMNEDLTLNETNGFKMYVNGVLEKSGNLSANNGALISGVSQPLQLLGKGPLSGSSQSSAFKGYLKNVRFYDSVLSQSQVSTIYTNMITNEYTDNKNFVSQTVPNLVISSSDISSGEHTETTSISMEITATTDSSLNITADDITIVNGTISNFTNNTTNTWSFDFTPSSSNVKSSVSISENSLLDNTINNMTDKPSWFTTNNNRASNVFEFMKTDVEMDLMPPLQDQTIAMITSTGSHIEIPVTLNGGVVYDASKNEYDISENGYLSIDEDVIRDGDLTISMMYAMRSGNQYGNDQLVNFSDSNSLNTSSDSTDIHIFRDGTTPGAWFYYGSPDDNGMAISEAGLEPSIVNTEVTQQEEFDSTDLQIEYIVDSQYITNLAWSSVYTSDEYGNDTPSTATIPASWVSSSDEDGNYLKIMTNKMDVPYPNETTYVMNMDEHTNTTTAKGFTYETWVKLPEGGSIGGDGWVLGLETGWGPCLVLDARGNRLSGWSLGGIGMTPYADDENTYDGSSPGYISDQPGNLLHIVGYMYRDPTSTAASNAMPFFRGVYVNGIHYAQTTTQQEGQASLPTFDGVRDNMHLRIGHNTSNQPVTNSDGLQIYSFRVWHRQLTSDEVTKLYSWGPQGSVISPPQITAGGLTPKYTHMAITVKEGQVKQFYINGEVVDYVNKYRSNALPVSRAIVGGKRQHQLFGYGYAANRGFSGLMKNIRIYNKALTAYEMRHLYAINSNFNDNDFSNTTVIPVPRPTLTFSAPLPESKILDSNGAEMTFNSFVKNGKEYKAYSFTNTGTTSITLDLDATDVEILIVGGGGAGGFWAGGGGGAGGVVYAVNQTLTAGTYNIEVGAGGVGWRQGGGVVPTSIGGDGIYHSQSGLDSYIHQETETYNDARYVKFETTGAITSPRTGVGLQFFQVDVIASGTITPITNATIHSSTRLGAQVPASNVLVDYGSDGTTSANSNGNTYWAGTGGQNSYFVMDLGQVYSLFQYRMKNTNNGVYGDRWTEDFKISISTDGVNFFDRISNTLQKNIKMTQAFKATKPAISMNMGGVSHELRGVGGGGGGNIINHDSGSQAAGVSGGSGGGSSGPWNNSSNNTIYTGGTATQGNTLYDISAQSYVAGGNNGNTLIGDALQTTNYKPIMGMGGGGASAIIYNDDDTDTGWSHVNGKNGIEIDIGGSTLTVAAGGGGSQMGYHQGWHGPPVKYNTDIIRGLGGSGGVGGDGMLWTSASENGWYQHLMGKDYPAHYKRLASDGADNTGSGGGGSQPGESGSAEAYYTSGSGGSGIVIIQFPKAEVASGSSLDQSTLDLTLTASDDGLDGNISSSDIITSNGTITAFSQTSPTTWDLTYTSDYNKQSNVGSLFIEQDTIYNNDVSDAFAPEPTIKYLVFQRVSDNYSRESAIGEIECVLNDNTNIALASNGATAEIYEDFSITDNVASWSTVSTFMASWTNGNYWADKAINGTTTGNFLHINHGTLLVSTVITLQDIHTLDAVQYLYVNNRQNTAYLDRITEHRFVLLDEDKNVVATTNEITVGEVEYTFNYSELNLQGDSFTPPSWWTREHNKASNKFEWTALNSGASDTSTTPTRPSITISSPDLNHGESQNLGTVPMTIYVSSNNLNVAQADLSFSNGVVSNFTKESNNYYTFDFKSASVSQASTIQVLQDTVSNAETSTDFNEASNVFEWTWSFTITPPEITITSTDVSHGGDFSGQDVNMLLEFGGDVLHGNSVESTFSQFDVSAENGYVFDISVISQSQIAFKLGSSSIAESTSVFIPQNIVSRTFNNIYTVNTNNVSNVFTWKYDSADLTVSSLVVNDANGNVISAGDYINENELWLQFTFSESIFNFNKSYFDTTNCKIANISSDTTFTTFTVKVETFFPTTASLQVKTDKFITSGRGLQKYVTGANNLSFNWNYDNTKPQISMTSSQASGLTNNVAFVDLSFISTIDTSDFTENSITVTGDASLSNFTAISATEYSVRVTPNSVSNIDITVPVNAYTEQYGNGNENSVSFSWNYDNVPPTVEIFSPDIANGASSSDPYINIYFTLSKPVDDFVLNDDVDLANGSFGPMTKTNTFVNHTTTFNVTVATKTASHPYNGSGSSAGYFLNGVESPTIDFIVGQTYTFNQSDSTNSTHPLKFYTTAEKDVLYTSGVVYTDSQGTSGATTTITIDENTPSPLFYQCANHGFMGYKGVVNKKESYTAKLYPMQNDTVSVYIFANSITDSAGNQNTTDSNEFDWIFDSNDLLTTLSSSNVANNGTFSNDSITISLATTAAIVDFVEADISYQNGTISNVDSSAKTFNITSNAQGVPTTAFIIGGAVETTQGESNIESNTFTWTYNPPIPKLVIKSSQINEGDYTNISSIDFTLTFDQENVIFDQNSLSIYNGTISSFSGSGTTYQVTVDTSVVSDDLIRLTLPQGNAHVVDNGNHYNDVSYNFEWNYDSVAPSITIGSSLVTQDASSTLTSLVLTLNSSEHIDGLRLSDFDVSNGVVSDLTNEGGLEDSSGSSYTLTIQPLDDTTDCSINICLNANSVVDRAGNTNAKSNDFGYSYIFFSRKLESSAIVELFEDDPEIPQEEKLSSSEIDLVISAAFTIPDTASPFAVAENESSDTGENDSSEQTDGEAIFVKPPKITFPPAIKIKNRKVFTKLIDQIFATTTESVTTLTIDKSSVAVSASAEAEIADVEEVVMVKSNQTEPVDMSALIEDPTKPSATYIPLANIGDFAIVAIGGVEYTTVVEGEGIFLLSSNNGGVIDNPNSGDGTWHSNDVYQATDINKIIFGSQIISTSPVSPDPPTLTITSGQVSGGGTTDISYIDLSFVFSTTVEISLNDIEALNANTTIISRTIVTDGSDSHIAVTIAPVDLCDNTIGVFVDVSAFYDSNNIFNDVQYTYSWNYSLDGGSSENGGTSDFIPCFLEGTKILTTKGYKNVELLNPKKDKLLDKDNNTLNFLDIQKYSQENNGKQYPYKIPHGSALSEDYTCNRDLYLTYNHCVYLPHLNKFAPVSAMKHLKEDKSLTQKKFTYYHVFTENYFSDTLMANGIPCESHSKYTFAKLRNIDPSDKLLRSVIKKADMLPNCMRNRLSIKEMKQVVKKFNRKQNKRKIKTK